MRSFLFTATVALLISSTIAHSSHVEDSNIDQLLLQKLSQTQHDELPAYAICFMQSYSSEFNISGVVRFSQNHALGVLVHGEIQGLSSNGTHAFHVHMYGDLSDGCTSLSSHYNPFEEDHGGPEACHRHVGDLGNLSADENGVAKFNFTDNKISLVGPYSIIGRSCVVHEDADDLGLGGDSTSLTTGNAGDRMGCGVVGRTISFADSS